MKIAYVLRPTWKEKSGGDVMQIQKYIDFGRKLGLFEGVIVSSREEVQGVACDAFHLTNIDLPSELKVSHDFISARRGKYFLSPIHHSFREIEHYERMGRKGVAALFSPVTHGSFRVLETARSLHRSLRYPYILPGVMELAINGYKSLGKKVLEGSQCVFLLSEKEGIDLEADFGPSSSNKIIIRNGTQVGQALSGLAKNIDVLIVGRIEARKNQISIIEALNKLGIKGVFVGAANENHKTYFNSFLKAIETGVGHEYLGKVQHEEVLSLMSRSRVHVSASWFEVLSLVDIEAASVECEVVVSQCGGSVELLAGQGFTCNPGNLQSIAVAIKSALELATKRADAKDRRIHQIVLPRWEDEVHKLYAAYKTAGN